MKPETDISATVLAIENRRATALLEMDLEALEDILDDEYRQIQVDGSVLAKEPLLASYRAGKRMWESAQSTDHKIQWVDDIAMLQARWQGTGVDDGIAFDDEFRIFAIYRKQAEKWKLLVNVSFPMTVPPEN